MFLKGEGGREYLVNQRAALGKDAIDFGSSVTNLTGKNHTVGTGPQTLIPALRVKLEVQNVVQQTSLDNSERSKFALAWKFGKLGFRQKFTFRQFVNFWLLTTTYSGCLVEAAMSQTILSLWKRE